MAATGAEIASAYVALTVKAPGIKRDIGKELGSVDTGSYGSQMGAKLADGMKKSLKLAGAGVAAVLGAALVKGFGRLKAIETAQAKMRGLGHDSKTVAKAMDNALMSVQGTAFGLGDAATVAGGAMAAQIKPGKELETHLKRIANNAAAAGVGFDEMGAIFNKAATQANGVQNDIIGQLADKGIPIYAELGKQMGVTAGEVFKLASEGKVSFEVFSKAAEAAAGTVAAEMGNTTTGAFDNMMAALGRLGAKILEDIFPLIGPLFQDITKWLDEATTHIEPVVDAIGVGMKEALDKVQTGWAWMRDNSGWLGPLAVSVGVATASIVSFNAASSAMAAIGLAGGVMKWVSATKAGTAAQTALNAVMNANPVMLVVTAIAALVAGLVFFFTQTTTGKKVWAEFTRFLGEAWANVSGFFKTVWETILKPVFDGLAAVATWVWQTILQPIFQFIGFAFAVVGGIFVGTYEALIKPVFDAIGKIVGWLWNTIVKPYFGLIRAYFVVIGNIVSWLWTNAVQPVFNFIGAIIRSVWVGFIKPVFDAMWAIIKNTLGPVFTWLRDTVIAPVWNGIKAVIDSVWKNGIKPVIDTMVRIVKSDPKKAFEAARDGIKTAWEAIKEIAKKPVRFVVETVINGLIGTMNKIPGVNLSKVSLPKGFAGGGVLPGYMSAKRDDVLMPMRSGEGVLVPEVVRGLGPGFVHALNAAGNSGGVSAVRAKFGAIGQGLAKGGMVHPLPGAVVTTPWMGYPGHTGIDLAKPQGTPVQAAAAGVVSKQFYHVNYGNMVDIAHGGGLSTRYAHMLANVAVKLGQSVKAGQVVGYEGSTGNSTGPHLHWEVLKNGNPVDPTGYLSGANGVKPLFGIIDGLFDFATGAFKKAFPGGGMWIDAAGGLMSQGVKNMVEWATDLLSIGGGTPLLYDNGGWLQPGLSLVNNKSGRPEPVFTATEFDRMVAGGGGFRDGARFELVLDDGTPLRGYIREQSSHVFSERAGAVSDGSLASTFGRRR